MTSSIGACEVDGEVAGGAPLAFVPGERFDPPGPVSESPDVLSQVAGPQPGMTAGPHSAQAVMIPALPARFPLPRIGGSEGIRIGGTLAAEIAAISGGNRIPTVRIRSKLPDRLAAGNLPQGGEAEASPDHVESGRSV
jgi:hypothetical protein